MNLVFDQYITKGHYEKNADTVLLEGDTFDILKQLPGNAFKLIVLSPFYNTGQIKNRNYEKEKCILMVY